MSHRHLFHSKNICPSSSLLQGKHLPFSPSPLRLNIFRLFVILSLTQLYRYTPRYFSFRLPHLNISTGPPQSDKLDKNSQRMWLIKNFSQWNGIQPLPVCAGFFIYIRNSLNRPCVTMPHDHLLSNVK
jgi:hypothetical protein